MNTATANETPQRMASPSGGVSLVKDLQKTDPSVPLSRAYPRAELGDSGTRIIHGIISEEYNPQLQGIQGIKVYDEMRKSDGTVRAAMLVTTLPIRRAEWFINAASDEPQDEEIKNFVGHALFDWIEDMSWDDILRQALLMCDYGVMLFEKVYGIKEHDGKTYVTLKKLAPRLPKSILMWELTDHTFGIQQIRQDGVLAQIPGSKLVIFVNEREGDNWWGNSMLRSAYKHWYYKNNFYKIDAIAFERQGLGIPKITMPMGYTESDEKKAVQAMQNLRANEDAFLLLPNGYEAEFMDMGAKSTRDPETSINHHNKEILMSVLAQFLELGANSKSSGSRALSQDHSDLFLKGIEAIANNVISVINKTLIPELVDLNFNDVKQYPVLDFSGIRKIDMTEFGTAFAQLVTAGALTPTDDDQQYLRAAFGLPPRSQADVDAQNDEEDDELNTEELEDGADIEDTETQQEEDVEDAATKQDPKAQTKQQNKKTDTQVKKKKAHDHLSPKRFDDGKGFMSWRPLTFTEKKVAFKNIQDQMDTMEANFTTEAKAVLTKAKDAFMAKLHDAIAKEDQKAISALEVQFAAEYKALLKTAMQKAYTYGKNNVSSEMGIDSPPNSAQSLANIDLMADTIATKTMTDIQTKAKTQAANAIGTGRSVLQTVGGIDEGLDTAIDKAISHTAGIIVGQNINMGRNDVFQRNQGMIYALQRSEVLDERTCEFCLSMDGLTVLPTDTWAGTDVFHENCRGIWVEILANEQDVEDIEITGVPSAVGDYYGGTPNELIQPPKAIVREGSPAAAEAARREAAKAAKRSKK
jgi:hypothetical protein